MSQFTFETEHKTMFSSLVLSDKQMGIVAQIVENLSASEVNPAKATNNQIRAACSAIWGMKYAHYFIYRNRAIRNDVTKTWDLTKLRSKTARVADAKKVKVLAEPLPSIACLLSAAKQPKPLLLDAPVPSPTAESVLDTLENHLIESAV